MTSARPVYHQPPSWIECHFRGPLVTSTVAVAACAETIPLLNIISYLEILETNNSRVLKI
ncbi:hypothetical protein T07_8880 [Trichinella nelsoni]|uniref:Uncharacterized protein n=1 Tax=Trichinella nelsoni TaxID=6336 RepID=A0A0V0SN78_9BILA|nr:hypothetical protein T07_8880 [Trichinella nelsoni]